MARDVVTVQECRWMGRGKDVVKDLKGCVVAVIVDSNVEEKLVVWGRGAGEKRVKPLNNVWFPGAAEV